VTPPKHTAHTPGPCIGINRDGWYWCEICEDLQAPCKHFPALFQAAPDLLEALKACMHWVPCHIQCRILAEAAIHKAEEGQ